jgi:hypothetical protein
MHSIAGQLYLMATGVSRALNSETSRRKPEAAGAALFLSIRRAALCCRRRRENPGRSFLTWDTPAAIKIERITAGPANPAAIPITTNIPAPMIAPMLIAVASKRPRVAFTPGVDGSAPFTRLRPSYALRKIAIGLIIHATFLRETTRE